MAVQSYCRMMQDRSCKILKSNEKEKVSEKQAFYLYRQYHLIFIDIEKSGLQFARRSFAFKKASGQSFFA